MRPVELTHSWAFLRSLWRQNRISPGWTPVSQSATSWQTWSSADGTSCRQPLWHPSSQDTQAHRPQPSAPCSGTDASCTVAAASSSCSRCILDFAVQRIQVQNEPSSRSRNMKLHRKMEILFGTSSCTPLWTLLQTARQDHVNPVQHYLNTVQVQPHLNTVHSN